MKVPEALIFLHIYKTAGTTLNRILESQYNPLLIFTIDPHGIRATAERFKTLSERRRRRFRVVRGHLFYGIHEFLPQGATYVTMLRDPVARLLSSYHFILRWRLHPLHRRFKAERLGVEDLIRLTPNRQNLQCKFIAGVGRIEDVNVLTKPAEVASSGISDERLLEIAKENLVRSFRVVGLAERFQESLSLMMIRFGWEIPFYQKRRVSKVSAEVETALAEMIREHNRLDVELYDFAKKIFEESVRKNEKAINDISATRAIIPKPGGLTRLCDSTLGAGRFLTSKIASAI
jgi:hypothetical protein